MVKRCYATLHGLSKFCCGLTREVKIILIGTLIFPHILYCITVWGGCGVTQSIQMIVNHCARIVFCTRMSERVSPLLKELEWSNVDELIGKRDVSFLNRLLCHPFAPHKLRNAIIHRSEVSSRDTLSTSAGLLQRDRP